MALKCRNYINGKWVNAASGKVFKSINPANTDEIVAEVARSGKPDVDRAVEAARASFREWSLMPSPRRGEILYRAAELLKKEKQPLGELVTREMGKVLLRPWVMSKRLLICPIIWQEKGEGSLERRYLQSCLIKIANL